MIQIRQLDHFSQLGQMRQWDHFSLLAQVRQFGHYSWLDQTSLLGHLRWLGQIRQLSKWAVWAKCEGKAILAFEPNEIIRSFELVWLNKFIVSIESMGPNEMARSI